jgi:uncharacterized protein (TIGR02001 family)
MRIQRSITFAVCLFTLPLYSQAELSITAGIFSDYVANGVTQTEGDPALQLSLDWANSDNLYAGAWASNVDFGEGTIIPRRSISMRAWYYRFLHRLALI